MGSGRCERWRAALAVDAALMEPVQLPNRYRIGPVVIDPLTREELVTLLAVAARERLGIRAGYVNAHIFERLHRDPELASALGRLDLVFCDGVGAWLGMRALGATVPERMTPPDFIDAILDRVAQDRGRIFLLGDEPEVVRLMAARLEERWPGLVAGYHHGFFRADEAGAVTEAVRSSRAALVLVGMGTPRQELWMADLRESCPGTCAIGVGGLFRWATGTEKRGPRWLTDHGFEWLCRLVVQPRKVARRYLVGLPRFAARVATLKLRGLRATGEVRSH